MQCAAGDIALPLQALRIQGFLLDRAPALSLFIKEVGSRARDGSAREVAGSALGFGRKPGGDLGRTSRDFYTILSGTVDSIRC